uniref:Uncharacterized protein n=1 Tax=Macaca mulatta TaxID=9544 RepID=F6TFE8_MACMU
MVEEAEPQHVDQQPGHADPKDHQRLLHLVRLDEALDGLQQDGEAEAGQEDGVHQSPHHLGSDPAERVLLGGVGPPGEALGHQRHHQRQHVRQHVEGVGEHRQRRGHPAHHHLQHHEHEGQRQHAQQPAPVPTPAPHGCGCGARRARPGDWCGGGVGGGRRVGDRDTEERPSRAVRETAEGPPRPHGDKPGSSRRAPRLWASSASRRRSAAQLLRRPSSEPAPRPGSAPAAPTPRRRRWRGAGLPERGTKSRSRSRSRRAAGEGGRRGQRAASRRESSEHLRALLAGLLRGGWTEERMAKELERRRRPQQLHSARSRAPSSPPRLCRRFTKKLCFALGTPVFTRTRA